MRPALEKLASARAEAIEFLAKNPDSELRNWLSVLVRATAPPTKEEALPVMVWQDSIRAQWATLTHFMGGDDAA